MAEVLQNNEFEEEDNFSLYETDQSGILSSTRMVLEEGEHVWINQERLDQLALQWVQGMLPRRIAPRSTLPYGTTNIIFTMVPNAP